MAGEEVLGHGKIVVEVEQNVRRELAEAEAQFDRTMAKLDRKEASLRLNANTKEFYAKVRKAQEDLKKWEHTKATATLDADTRKANAGIANATRRLKEYERDNINIYNRIGQLDSDRARAHEVMASKVDAGERKVQNAISKTAATSEKAAYREDSARQRVSDRNQARHDKDMANVGDLTRQYTKMRKELQELERQRRKPFLGQHERIQIDLDTKQLNVRLAEVRARLAAIGHPPPEVHIDVDDDGISTLRRWADAITGTTIRLGPFTTSIGGAVRALALLGPIITGLVGATAALASSIGMGLGGGIGIASAAAIGFLPLLGAVALTTKGMVSQFSDAKKATDKVTKAQLKYGEGSKQAKKAQDELNHVLKNIDPAAAQAFKGFTKLRTEWHKAVDDVARRNIGKVMNEGVKTAGALLPMFASQTKRTFKTLGDGISGWMQGLRSSGGQNVLNKIFSNANRALGPLLSGLGKLGAVAGKVLGEFSKYLPGLSRGFEDWADRLNDTTDRSNNFSHGIRQMVQSFKAVVTVLGSAGKLLAAFMQAGNDPGRNFLLDIASGMDRITENIRRNPEGLGNFFEESIKTTKQLYEVLKPLAALFMEWATIMRPFSSIMLHVAASLAKVVDALADFGPTRAIMTGAFSLFLTGMLANKVMGAVKAFIALRATLAAIGGMKIAQGGIMAGMNALMAGAPANLARNFGRQKAAVTAMTATSAIPSNLGRSAAQAEAKMAAAGVAAGTASTKVGLLRSAAAVAVPAIGEMGVVAGSAATGGLAILAGGAAYGAYKLITMKSASDKLHDSLKGVTDNTVAYNKVTGALLAVQNEAGQSTYTYGESIKHTAALKKQLNALENAGKKGTAEYRAKLQELNDALNERQANETKVSKLERAKVDLQNRHQVLLGQRKDAEDLLNKALDRQKKAQERVTQEHMRGEAAANAMKEVNKDVADATEAYNTQLRAEQAAQRAAILGGINYERGLRNLIPAAGKAATALVNLAKRAPKLTQTISLKYADPKDAGRVAARANAALKSGSSGKIVTRIVADSKSAEEAVRRLNRARITPKKLEIIESGGKHAVNVLENIIGRKLTPKEQKIAEKGGPGVIHLLEQITGHKFRTKTQKVQEQGSSGVLGWLNKLRRFGLPGKTQAVRKSDPDGILGWLQAIKNIKLPDKTQTVRTRHSKFDGGFVPFAAGGVADRMIDYAYDRAASRGPKRTNGGRYGSPTLLVGEEKRTEYVIATNPAYRKRNVGYLKSAASEFGMNVVDSAAGGKTVKKPPKPKKGAATKKGAPPKVIDTGEGIGTYAIDKGKYDKAGGYHANREVQNISANAKAYVFHKPAPLSKKQRRKNISPALAQVKNPWTQFIKGLLEQQSDLEREVTFAERGVKEPDSFVNEVKDPDTGEVVDYTLNQAAIDEYKASLLPVMEIYDSLKKVVQEIVQSVPIAIDSLRQEIEARNFNIHELQKEIAKQEKRARVKPHTKQLKGNKAQRRSIAADNKKERDRVGRIHADAQGRLKKLRPLLSGEERARDQAVDASNELSDETRKEAGFDYRDYDAAYNEYSKSYYGAQGRAQSELDQDKQEMAWEKERQRRADAEKDGKGGGAAEQTLTYGQQAALADTERANVLRDFGSNVYSQNVRAGQGGPAQGASPVLNPSAMGGAGVTRPTTDAEVAASKTFKAVAGGVYTAVNDLASAGVITNPDAARVTGNPSIGGGGVGSVLSASVAGSRAASTMAGATAGTAAVAGTPTVAEQGAGKTINITNNWLTPAPDPHTYIKGVEFEASAIV